MPTPNHLAAATLLALATLAPTARMLAQTPSQKAPQLPAPQAPTPQVAPPTPMNRMVILLDPAHGGIDSGSRIGDSTLEKEVTLALAFKLRSLLSARGLTVVMTRDADSPTEPNAAGTPLTLDDRAGIANHAHPVACILLHATRAGKGVHLYNSELTPSAGVSTPQPWITAQAAWIPASRELEKRMATALGRAGVATVSSSASVLPVDSLACPALVVELAPETDEDDSINDADYQQRVALSIAGALFFWHNEAQSPIQLLTASHASAAQEQQP